jgi:quinol monooxygenase YgiN
VSDNVSWSIHTSVIEGRLDDARDLMSEMVESSRGEAGTIGYEWFLNEDGTVCHIKDRYADSGAAMVHLGNFGHNFAERFMECFEVTAFFVYGEPNDEVRGAISDFGPVYLGTFGGFNR